MIFRQSGRAAAADDDDDETTERILKIPPPPSPFPAQNVGDVGGGGTYTEERHTCDMLLHCSINGE